MGYLGFILLWLFFGFHFFQFPLWDTGSWIDYGEYKALKLSIPFMGYKNNITVSRLVEQLINFQFPLWDTFYLLFLMKPYLAFQFPLWDTSRRI